MRLICVLTLHTPQARFDELDVDKSGRLDKNDLAHIAAAAKAQQQSKQAAHHRAPFVAVGADEVATPAPHGLVAPAAAMAVSAASGVGQEGDAEAV